MLETSNPLDWLGGLSRAEELSIGTVHESRRMEFEVGRNLARSALAILDDAMANIEIVRGEDGSPVWANGVCGSISHCPGLTAVAVTQSRGIISVGIDVVILNRISQEISAYVMNDFEHQAMAAYCRVKMAITFTAKEAVRKAWCHATGELISLRRISISLLCDDSSFLALIDSGTDSYVFGRYVSTDGVVASAVVIYGH